MTTELYERGLATRKRVLGEQEVSQALAQATTYSQPLQDVLNEYAFGAVWSRPGLNARDRSMITVAMLIALNRSQALKTYLAAALRNGVTREEISELLLHANIYCGSPAAVDAFRVMREVFAAADAQPGGKP